MSFIACIGNLISGSDFWELLGKIYAYNAVKHMLSGNDIARTIRGYLLLDAALSIMPVSNAYNIPWPQHFKQVNKPTKVKENERNICHKE